MLILSINGGGVRIILAGRILERVEHEFPGWKSKIGIIAGNSAGGLAALGIASGMSAKDLSDYLQEFVSEVFTRSWWEWFSSGFGVTRPKYRSYRLRKTLTNVFGDAKISDLDVPVLVPAFFLGDTYRPPAPKFFDNSDDVLISDVALATTAAPTYFPPSNRYVDGVIAGANDPSVNAIAYAKTMGVPLADIRLLNLAAGSIAVDPLDGNWGKAQWAVPIIDLLMEGSMATSEFLVSKLLPTENSYLQINPVLERAVPLDDAGSVDELLAIADAVDIGPLLEWLQQ